MLISSTLAGNRFLNFFLGSIVEYPAAFLEYVSINRYYQASVTTQVVLDDSPLLVIDDCVLVLDDRLQVLDDICLVLGDSGEE